MKAAKNRISPPGFYPQQIDALNWLKAFMESDDLEATLSGYAGTGKTYILKYFVSHICNVSLCPTAPTHKAVRVVEKVLNRKGKTLQSLHGLRPNLDLANFNIASPQFDPKGIEYIKNYKLVIIDEASMISSDIYELNLRRAKQYGTKILYVGDPLQLPPVQTTGTESRVFKVKNRFNLTQIVRQEEGSSLLSLFPYIRNDVLNGTSNFLKYILVNRESMDNGTGYKIVNETNYKKELQQYFKLDLLKKDLEYVRVIAYTNKRVKQTNSVIRNSLIEDSSELLHENDILTSYVTIVDEFNYPIITNSEDYYIESVRPYVNQFEIKTFAVNLRSVYDNSITSTLQIVDHNDKSFKTYYQILNHLHYKAINAHKSERSKKWVEYYKFKESMLSMLTFKLNEENGNSTVKKDIDYGYAITGHKSQGSTFENVFIDLEDILYYTDRSGKLRTRYDINMINRLIYVALSRASKKVILKL